MYFSFIIKQIEVPYKHCGVSKVSKCSVHREITGLFWEGGLKRQSVSDIQVYSDRQYEKNNCFFTLKHVNMF